MSDVLAPPFMGSMEQGTLSDWFAALDSAFDEVEAYSKKVIKEAEE